MRVAAVVPDLLLASRVKELLEGAGHEVALVRSAADAGGADALVADLMETDPAELAAAGPPVLGIYAHTSPDVRDRALAAGVAVAVPRSRFMREAGDLVAALVPAS